MNEFDLDSRESIQPVFEGFIVSTPYPEQGRAMDLAIEVMRRQDIVRFEPEPLGEFSPDVLLRAPEPGYFSIGEAWTIARRLLADPALVDAEPSFVTQGLWPNPVQVPERMRLPSGAPPTWLEMLTPGAATAGAMTDCEWSIKACNIPDAWAFSAASGAIPYGSGITVAHPDTGYLDHWDFSDPRVLIKSGRDFFSGSSDPKDQLGGSNFSHGLSTGSVIMSNIGPRSKPAFVSGAAPEAMLVPLRVSDSVIHISYANLCKALNYAAEKQWDVCSMSLGGPRDSRALKRALEHAAGQGMVLVAASGNYYPWVVYPARYDETVACCATNVNDDVWKHASSGAAVDVAAPGESVWRAAVDNNDNQIVAPSDGTSYATATVAGIAALWLAHHGSSNLRTRFPGNQLPAVFKDLLMKTSRRPSGWNPKKHGAGIADALQLLKAPLSPTAHAKGFAGIGAPFGAIPRNELEVLADYFPEVEPFAALKVLRGLFGSGLSYEDFRETLHEFVDEIAFHLATDADSRQFLLDAMREYESGSQYLLTQRAWGNGFLNGSGELKRMLGI